MGKYLYLKKFNLRHHYIVTAPRRRSEIGDDEFFYDQIDYRLLDKARRLQARRWRRLKRQVI